MREKNGTDFESRFLYAGALEEIVGKGKRLDDY